MNYKAVGSYKHLGSFIRERRMLAGYRQFHMADELGFKSDRMCEIEKGFSRLRGARALRFCELTNTDIHLFIVKATESFRELLLEELVQAQKEKLEMQGSIEFELNKEETE